MRATRTLSVVLIAALLFAQVAVASAAQPAKVKTVGQGQTYCPSRTIVNNKIAVKHGACYTLFDMRDAKKTYLAFGPKDAKLAVGQVVRLDTPAGAKLGKRMLYRIPIKAGADIVPVNSIRIVGAKVEDFGTRVSLTILGTPSENLLVMFSVRQTSAKK